MNRMKYAALLLLGMFVYTPANAQDEVAAPTDAPAVATEAPADAPDEAVVPVNEAVTPADEAAPADEAVAPADGAAPAEEIETPEEALQAGTALYQAILSKNWPLAVGLACLILVFILNKAVNLKEKVGSKALPWIAMAFAVAGTVGAALIGGVGWLNALLQGFMAGVVAIGGWELLFKHILGNKTKVA